MPLNPFLKKKSLLIVDRYHVVKRYRGAVDKYRQKILKALKKELPTKEYEKIKNVMPILRRGKEYMTPEEKELKYPKLGQFSADAHETPAEYTAWSVQLLSELRGKIQERFLVARLDTDSSNLVNYMIRKHDYLIVRLALMDGSLKELETKLGTGLTYAKCKLKV